jgi:hypothetical protein
MESEECRHWCIIPPLLTGGRAACLERLCEGNACKAYRPTCAVWALPQAMVVQWLACEGVPIPGVTDSSGSSTNRAPGGGLRLPSRSAHAVAAVDWALASGVLADDAAVLAAAPPGMEVGALHAEALQDASSWMRGRRVQAAAADAGAAVTRWGGGSTGRGCLPALLARHQGQQAWLQFGSLCDGTWIVTVLTHDCVLWSRQNLVGTCFSAGRLCEWLVGWWLGVGSLARCRLWNAAATRA